jgi:hypothetical protein
MSALPESSSSTVHPIGDGRAARSADDGPPIERRRLLVGDLVVRHVSYRSVARVAFPVLAGCYAALVGVGVLVWNVAALTGWSPGDDGLVGTEVFWSAVAAGVVLIPLGVTGALGVAGLYNLVSDRVGGIEIAVVSPRRGHHR